MTPVHVAKILSKSALLSPALGSTQKRPHWSSRLIQEITVDESPQKDSVISFCSSSLTMDVANLVPIVAANNSSLGIVIVLTGGTRVLA
jgi:hypothetical protein